MLIKEWLAGFLMQHRTAWPDAGWPPEGSPMDRRMWHMWFDAFKADKVREPEARTASKHVGDIPAGDHPARIVGLVRQARDRAAEMEAASAQRETALVASRDCPQCDGTGMCEVFDPNYDGRRVMDKEFAMPGGGILRRPFAMVVAAHCTCPMGRWVRSKTAPEHSCRIPDLVEVLAGRSRWVAQDPTGDTPSPWDRGPDTGGPIHAPGGVPKED